MDSPAIKTPQERNPKTVFSLDEPAALSTPQWPEISYDQEQDLVDLLCSLLESTKNSKDGHSNIIVGFNAVIVQLETMAKATLPKTVARNLQVLEEPADKGHRSAEEKLVAVFVTRLDGQSSALHAHFPMLCALSAVPLLQMPKGSEARLCHALGRSNIGVVALVGNGPRVASISTFIQERRLGLVELPGWLTSSRPTWSPTKVKGVQSTTPATIKKEDKANLIIR